MKIPIALIPGLPKRELVERIHFHQRQGEIADRALGFYLHDMDKRKMFRPYEDAAMWARKHLPQRERPDRLILLAKRLEQLTLIEAAFHSGEVPWTKIREIARIAKPHTQEVWLKAARRLTCRELEEEVRGKKAGDRPGGGLKARRTKYKEELHLPPEGKAIWDKSIRKVMRELPPGSTPSDAAVELARRDLERGPAANVSEEKAQKSAVDLVVLHLGPNGESWVDSKDGRLEIDPRIIAEKIHVVQAAERLGIDERGLDRVDREVVKLLLRRGKPTGLEAIASRIGVDVETYRDVHEPWLERSGLVERTRDGRVATEEAREIYGSWARFSA